MSLEGIYRGGFYVSANESRFCYRYPILLECKIAYTSYFCENGLDQADMKAKNGQGMMSIRNDVSHRSRNRSIPPHRLKKRPGFPFQPVPLYPRPVPF